MKFGQNLTHFMGLLSHHKLLQLTYDTCKKVFLWVPDFEKITFRYEFFVITPRFHTLHHTTNLWFSQNFQFSKFTYGMSSYSDEFLCEKMVSLMCENTSNIMMMFSWRLQWILKIHKFLDFWKVKFEISKFRKCQSYSKSIARCVYDTSMGPVTSYLFSKNFLHTQPMFPFLPTSISKNYLFSQIRLPKFIMVEFFGMSSYGPESSFIKKYEFWRKFYIFIMSSYLL